MNLLEMRTVIFSYFITNALITWFIALLWHQNRKRYAGLGFWLIDFILQALGVLLLSLRGIAPDLVTVVLAQTLIAAGMLCLLIGLARFVGEPGSQFHNYLSIAGFAGLMAYFTFIQSDISIRTILISAAVILFTGQCSWLLLRRAAPSLRPITRDTGVVLLLYTFMAFFRIISLLVTPLSPASGLFESPLLQVVYVFINQILCIVLTFALIMMVTRRLELDVQTQAAERTHAEQVLAESQKRFALAFHMSPYAITITRASDGKMIEVNEGFTHITGYSAAECLGKTTLELNLWVDDQERAQIVAELARGKPITGMVLRFRKKDGAMISGLLSANTFMLGDQMAILSSIDDITNRKQAEEALRASEARYRAVAQTANDAIISADSAGIIVSWNHGAQRIFGYTEAEAVGQALTLLVPQQFSEGHLAGIRRMQSGGERHVIGKMVELSGLRKDGSEFPLELTLSEWQVAEGRFYTSIIRDITERKRAEEDLRESEERFRTLFEQAAVGVALLDTKTGRYVRINQKYCDFLGYTIEEMLHRTLNAVTYPEDVQTNLDNNALLLSGTSKEFSIEKRYLRKDGTIVWGHLTASPLWKPGTQPDAYLHIAMVEDITERKQMEEKLKEASIHDALTGLYNRRFFEEEMTRLERGRHFPVSIVMADLNELKEINDRDGHVAGDALLQRAAQVFNAAFRADDIIARIGGDEFAILLPDADAGSAHQLLRRVRFALDEHNATHGGAPLSIAFGVSTAEQGGALTDALKEADARMYAEKRDR